MVKETDILKFIMLSGILEQHQLQDACLNELREVVLGTTDDLLPYKNISIRPVKNLSEFRIIHQGRLNSIPDTPELEAQKAALTKLVDYCIANPEASIWIVIFECPKNSYLVYCGQTADQRLDAICVMFGRG